MVRGRRLSDCPPPNDLRRNFCVTLLDRYLARLIAVPLFATLVISAMLLVLDRMLRLFDFVAAEGGPVGVVWRMLGNLLPEYLSLGIPIGLMLGILLAFRRLATSSELDVMRGVGLSYTRLLRVPYAYAIVLAALNFAIVSYVQPKARYAYEGLRFELRSGALGAAIKVGEFNQLGERLTIRVENSAAEGQRLGGLFVELRPKNGTTITATAQRGEFLQSGDADTVLLRLADGVLVQEGPMLTGPRVLTFEQQDLPIQLPRTEAFRARGEQHREYTLPELVQQSRTGATERERDESLANLHFRLAEVAMTLLLPLLAVALAVPPKRSSSALGVFLSIIFVVTYYKVNEYMEGVGAIGAVDPVVALWLPFAAFAGVIVWLFWTLAFKAGGQPIGVLETAFSAIGKAITAPFRRRVEPA